MILTGGGLRCGQRGIQAGAEHFCRVEVGFGRSYGEKCHDEEIHSPLCREVQEHRLSEPEIFAGGVLFIFSVRLSLKFLVVYNFSSPEF